MVNLPKLGRLNPISLIKKYVKTDWSQVNFGSLSLYQTFHFYLQEFWKIHRIPALQHQDSRISLSSFRMTCIKTMQDMGLTVNEMRKITFHRGDTLQNVYLMKKYNSIQRKYCEKLENLF